MCLSGFECQHVGHPFGIFANDSISRECKKSGYRVASAMMDFQGAPGSLDNFPKWLEPQRVITIWIAITKSTSDRWPRH